MDCAVKSNEEMASEFIVSTCQLIPKSFSVISDRMHDLMDSGNPGPTTYMILCGSSAEFYIRPLNTCIGDNDYLICNTNQLAFSGDVPVLPSDRSGLADAIELLMIESIIEYPSFVRLHCLGEIRYNWKWKKYEYNETARTGQCLAVDMGASANTIFAQYDPTSRSWFPNTICGPAVKSNSNSDIAFAKDAVHGLFCPEWPREAKNWGFRPRKCGWPLTDTISKVVQNGCHVVYAQHRSCREDKLQWRLSFSFAELILLQSWTKIQQIVYHLLRFFAKRELIHKDCLKEDEVLCTYHLKTLMLWTCEEKSPEWWDSASVIAICSELLKKLSEWLKKRYCPNYFIPKANLFHDQWNPKILDTIETRLENFCNSGILSHWFVENYILPVTRTQFRVLNKTKVKPGIISCFLPLPKYRKAIEPASLNLFLTCGLSASNKHFRYPIKSRHSIGLRRQLRYGQYTQSYNPKCQDGWVFVKTLQKDLCFKYCNILLCILHAAYGLRHGEFSWESSLFVECVDAISLQSKIVRSLHHNFPKIYTEQSGRFEFLRAQSLMENLNGSNSCSEFQLITLMSTEFLRKSLKCYDSKLNGIAPAALAYLAALHFAKFQYHQAIHFCSKVFVDQISHNDEETLNAGCLLFIDDVARIVGLCLLHKKIKEKNLHYINSRLYLDLRLSPKIFAHFLTILSVRKTSIHLDFCRDFPRSTFSMDENLTDLLKPKWFSLIMPGTQFHINVTRQIVYRRTDSLAGTEATDVNSLNVKEAITYILMDYALENMKSFYSVIRKDFGIQCNVVDCYRATHLFKCRQYNEVLNLCEQILREPDPRNDLKEFAFANLLLLPPLVSFFDDEIQSLLGFHTLFSYLSPHCDTFLKLGLDLSSTFACSHPAKSQYILGRHFLARYLKVRCCIERNLSYLEALAEFAAQKINLPFERIIRRFLLQRACYKQNIS